MALVKRNIDTLKSMPMRKSDKPMWQNATHGTRKSICIPQQPRATMEYEINKPAGYTGI